MNLYPTGQPGVQIDSGTVNKRITDPGRGKHLWIFSVAFRAADELIERMGTGEPSGAVLFDHENVITVQGPGCYKCEQSFHPAMLAKPCRGSMEP